MSGKNPAFQFYPSDWIRDPQLRQATFQTRGIWIDVLCYMWWSDKKGSLTGTKDGLSRLLGCSTIEFDVFIEELKLLGFGDVTFDNETITLNNRRMVKDEKARENNRLRQQRFKEKQVDNGLITDIKQHPPPLSGEGDGEGEGIKGNGSSKSCNYMEEIKDIVSHLNETAGTNYRSTSKQTQSSIRGRLEEGYTVDNFKTVHMKKAEEWMGTEHEKYLRPSTLYRPQNFEEYLNQKINKLTTPHKPEFKISWDHPE